MAEGSKYPSNFAQFKRKSPFLAETLTKKDHDEPELHFIGDALPVPTKIMGVIGDQSLFPNGYVGTSPIPSREDHVHVFKRDIYSGSHTITGMTLGNAVVNIWRSKVGGLCEIAGSIHLGSSSAVTGDIAITNPDWEPCKVQCFGTAFFGDASVGAEVMGLASFTGSTLYLRRWNVIVPDVRQAFLSATTPFTWAVNDFLRFSVVYIMMESA